MALMALAAWSSAMMNKYWVDGFAWGGRRCVSLDEHYEDRPVASGLQTIDVARVV